MRELTRQGTNAKKKKARKKKKEKKKKQKKKKEKKKKKQTSRTSALLFSQYYDATATLDDNLDSISWIDVVGSAHGTVMILELAVQRNKRAPAEIVGNKSNKAEWWKRKEQEKTQREKEKKRKKRNREIEK